MNTAQQMCYAMRGSALCLILLVSAGCFRYNSDAAVLAPLASGQLEFSEKGTRAEYLAFEDEVTASVFRTLNQRYRIAPAGAVLLCPDNPAEGLHGYSLRGVVVSRTGDEAIATIRQTCRQPHSTIVINSEYLLDRRYGTWRIVKPLGGSIGIMGKLPTSDDERLLLGVSRLSRSLLVLRVERRGLDRGTARTNSVTEPGIGVA